MMSGNALWAWRVSSSVTRSQVCVSDTEGTDSAFCAETPTSGLFRRGYIKIVPVFRARRDDPPHSRGLRGRDLSHKAFGTPVERVQGGDRTISVVLGKPTKVVALASLRRGTLLAAIPENIGDARQGKDVKIVDSRGRHPWHRRVVSPLRPKRGHTRGRMRIVAHILSFCGKAWPLVRRRRCTGPRGRSIMAAHRHPRVGGYTARRKTGWDPQR